MCFHLLSPDTRFVIIRSSMSYELALLLIETVWLRLKNSPHTCHVFSTVFRNRRVHIMNSLEPKIRYYLSFVLIFWQSINKYRGRRKERYHFNREESLTKDVSRLLGISNVWGFEIMQERCLLGMRNF